MIEVDWLKNLSPRDALRILWKRRWLFILPVILVTLAAWASSFIITPIYRSSVTIAYGNPVIVSNDLQRLTGFSGNVVGGDIDHNRERRALQNEITSTQFLSQLAYRMNLDKDPRLEASARKAAALHPELTVEEIKLEMLVDNLKNIIQIELVASNQVRISVFSNQAQKAKSLAENLGNIFMSEKKQQMLRMVYSSIDFAYEQLEKYNAELQEKVDEKTRLEESMLRLQVHGSIGSDDLRKQVNDEIQSTQSEIDNLKNEETQAKLELTEINDSRLIITNSALVNQKKTQLKDYYAQMAEVLKREHWKDPSVINLKEKIYGLEQEIDQEIRYQVELQFSGQPPKTISYLKQLLIARESQEVMYAKLNSLRLALAGLDKNITLMPDYQSRLDQLDREITAARDLRDQFQRQQEGFQISQKILSQSRIDLIEPARVPLAPVRPNKNQLLLVGLLLGFALGGTAVLLAELFDNSIKRADWIEGALGVKVIGTVPKITWQNQSRVGPRPPKSKPPKAKTAKA